MTNGSVNVPLRPGAYNHGASACPTQADMSQRTANLFSLLMAPMRYTQYYLWGTVAIFLSSNLVGDVPNLPLLLIFLLMAYGGFYLGYRIAIGPRRIYKIPAHLPEFGETKQHQWLVIAGALYFVIWGVNQFVEFGGTNIGGIIQGIFTPGEAYRAKFDVFEARISSGYVSPVVQMLILLSVLYAVFLPLSIASWPRLSRGLRAVVVTATLIYVASFLFIGTMKGVGDVMLLVICGGAVLVGKRSLLGVGYAMRRNVRRMIIVLGVLLFAYMATNQVQRAEEFGITESAIVGDVSDTFVARTFGPNAAYGFYQVLAYPSHGYLGLGYSMSMPFEFSYGAGFSQAYESYRAQFLGGEDNIYLTYPYRSEQVTGWPAGMFWSTIFPWLASDLTFYLVPLFMAAMGALFARLWVNCLDGANALALTALGQVIIFIAFIPANNQVLMQRQGLWVVIWLLALAGLRLLKKRQPA